MKKNLRQLALGLFLWLPPLAWMVFIFQLSSGPLPDSPITFKWSDKVAHFGAYGLLGLLLWRALRSSPAPWRERSVAGAVVFALLYGASDELHQALVPGRQAEVADWLADAAGAFVMVNLCQWFLARFLRSPVQTGS